MTAQDDPEPAQEADRGPSAIDPATGCMRVLSRLCDTCITYPDDRMLLGERRQEFIDEARVRGTYVVCHDTGTYSPHPGAVCRGFFNRHWRETAALRLAQRLGLVVFVEPPAEGVVPRDRA